MQLRRTFMHFFNKIFFKLLLNLKKDIKCNSDWYGSDYGGFFMNPDSLNKESIIYSFGLGQDISFDKAAIARHQCKVFGFDFTPKSIEWLNKQELPGNFTFYNYGIGSESGLVTFFMPKNENHVSGSIINNKIVNQQNKIQVPVKCISDIVIDLNHTAIDVIKMDIEGAEYDVLPGILNSNIQIGQFLIEFHHKTLKNGIAKTRELINLLHNDGFELFAISPSSNELSFINKKMLSV